MESTGERTNNGMSLTLNTEEQTLKLNVLSLISDLTSVRNPDRVKDMQDLYDAYKHKVNSKEPCYTKE